MALLPYSGASEFPSCFRNLSFEEKQAAGQKKIDQRLDRLDENLRVLEPKLVLPFAGQYILGGRMTYKNRCLGVPTQKSAVERIEGLGFDGVNPREGDVIDVASHSLEHTLPPYTGAP